VGFISSLPQLAWDKRLSCCFCCCCCSRLHRICFSLNLSRLNVGVNRTNVKGFLAYWRNIRVWVICRATHQRNSPKPTWYTEGLGSPELARPVCEVAPGGRRQGREGTWVKLRARAASERGATRERRVQVLVPGRVAEWSCCLICIWRSCCLICAGAAA
jgi:hypothetical protein